MPVTAGHRVNAETDCDIDPLILTIDYFLRPVGAKFSIRTSETRALPKSQFSSYKGNDEDFS